MTDRRPTWSKYSITDATPLPDSIPPVKELGASSAPLLSASFFIGARCRDYNDDYMQCKTEAYGRGEFDCLKEGRRVTRCARSVIRDLNAHCAGEFRNHWQCLDNRNHQLHQCRGQEFILNRCAFEKLGFVKVVPDQPPKDTPVHLRQKQQHADIRYIFAPAFIPPTPGEKPSDATVAQPKAA